MLTINGYSPNSEKYNVINRTGRYTEEIDCFAKFRGEAAEFKFRSEYDVAYPSRPYLVINGTIDGVLASSETLGLLNVNFDDTNKYENTMIYEFTDAELADLAAKGMYRSEFEIPSEMFEREFNVPKKVRLDMIVNVEEDENGVQRYAHTPLVFANVIDGNISEVDERSLGESLASMFKAVEVEDAYVIEDEISKENETEEEFMNAEDYIDENVHYDESEYVNGEQDVASEEIDDNFEDEFENGYYEEYDEEVLKKFEEIEAKARELGQISTEEEMLKYLEKAEEEDDKDYDETVKDSEEVEEDKEVSEESTEDEVRRREEFEGRVAAFMAEVDKLGIKLEKVVKKVSEETRKFEPVEIKINKNNEDENDLESEF